ncbi:protein kinase domain-containing protein [Hazenella coriacea]|uniref:Protein kinase-like protein n=1 Tax=Hazenella coriacea TaxID=1179467 RepID=A0A4V2UV99_9BACL|nr:protein kinase [Hazenella coriacea]TCS94967.1 protein kinase-like protein [Hazenella coriacea]
MLSTKDVHLDYLSSKVNEYIERFGDENIQKYMGLYDTVPIPVLKRLFSVFHYQLNFLFNYMNARLNNGHYTAEESRELIYLHEQLESLQLNLERSEYYFYVDPHYEEILNECDGFLESSFGSAIPSNFQKINLIETKPIFSLTPIKKISKEFIGKGSYASVYKYYDDYYKRFFVIKKADKNLSEDEYKRFKIEFEEMGKLKSPYVIEVYNFDEKNRQYIMEYADDTLYNYISKNNSKLEVGERIRLVKQILRAFIYINNRGVLHRDISPTNVLLKKYDGINVIKVSDFGLVKLEDSVLTRDSTEIKGIFNDPDLEFLGFSKYEIRHETYSLTRLIHFVMTGRSRITNKNGVFYKFIEKGISQDINKRYKNVEELQKEFNNFIESLNKSDIKKIKI